MDHNEKNWIPFQREGKTYVARSLSTTNSRASEPNSIFWASDPILLTVFWEQKYVFFKLMFLNF